MGRSLGSAPAIELASTRGSDIAGLIVESGFAQTPPLLALFGISLASLGLRDMSGMDNEDKMANVQMPVLVLHAVGDVLLAPWNGERIHERAASDEKKSGDDPERRPQHDHGVRRPRVLGRYREVSGGAPEMTITFELVRASKSD